MAKKSTWVTWGRRKLELSNLDKVLYPEEGFTKAEVIRYYTTVAPAMLRHVQGRALTLIRFPDGLKGESFYQKNRPEWAPAWIEFERLGKSEPKDYLIATEVASLAWMANLAALEIHQLHARRPHLDLPDYMVFDLDPPEGYAFQDVVALAIALRQHLELSGYTPFVKTSGGKGLHLCCPLRPTASFDQVFEVAHQIANDFVAPRQRECTLQLKKEARKGRVLIDIYRNRSGQSIVSPYSLRARPGAPVSMPLSWERLLHTATPGEWNIHTVPVALSSAGDAWENFEAFAVELHTLRKIRARPKRMVASAKAKTPAQLKSYAAKRNFSQTPEPQARAAAGAHNRFVLHRHHASHLHYDLRLEQNGVLRSWALPKGLPPLPGIKRLAIQTEDHPVEYLTFDGRIPEGQYGAGEMRIFLAGQYRITKEKEDGFYFRLSSPQFTGDFRIYRIKKDQEWLLERVDWPLPNLLAGPVPPMLATLAKKIPKGKHWGFEVKWDGIRANMVIEERGVRLFTRQGLEITGRFPELTTPDFFRGASASWDGEIVCLDAAGRPVFSDVIKRMSRPYQKGAPPAVYYVFDALYLDGRSLMMEPLAKRRAWLADSLQKHGHVRLSEMVAQGEGLWQAARAHELEGIMAKDLNSAYVPGKRTENWLKLKARQTIECAVLGFTKGQGAWTHSFGSLYLAKKKKGGWTYLGKVGTGFDDAQRTSIMQQLKKAGAAPRPISDKLPDTRTAVWLKHPLVAEIKYASITREGLLREPVFIRLLPDRPPADDSE